MGEGGCPQDLLPATSSSMPREGKIWSARAEASNSLAWLRRGSTTSVYRMRGFVRGQDLVEGHLHEIGMPPR